MIDFIFFILSFFPFSIKGFIFLIDESIIYEEDIIKYLFCDNWYKILFMFKNKEYVLEVNKEKSFSKAAQNLYVSQPSLSAMVKKVEDKAGMQIFDRSTTPIKLTEFGEKYVETALKIHHLEEDFGEYVDSLKNITAGTLSIGSTTFLSSVLLPPILEKYSSKYPKVSLKLIEGNIIELEKHLATGELDFVIEANHFDEQIYAKKKIHHEHLILAVSKNIDCYDVVKSHEISLEDIIENRHLHKKLPPVPLELLEGAPFILLREGNDIRLRADKIMESCGFMPSAQLSVDQLMTAFHLVERGLGVTFLTDTLVKNIPIGNNIAFFRLENGDVHRDIFLYRKANRIMTPAMEKFLELVL